MRICFFSLVLLACLAHAHSKPDLSKNLSIKHEQYTLDNGLNVILAPDKTSPFIAVNIWYQVGSTNEEPKKTGLAHLFEHLMFEGSAHVPTDEHFKLLEDAGGSSINASTSYDRTNYYETVPKNKLELALAMEASRMSFLNISQEKLDEQRAVVKREREQRFENAPYGNALLKAWENIFPKYHPLHGMVIGSHKHLEKAQLNDVKLFYNQYYGPSNASLALVGDLDIHEAKALIDKYFASLPKTELITKKPLPKLEIKEETIKLEEKLGKLTLIRLQYITPALFKAGDAELDILAHILTGGEFGRLTKAISRDNHYVNKVSAYQQSMEQLSVFSIDAILNPGVKEESVIEKIDEVLRDLVSNPPSSIEIERAKNSIFTDYFFRLQSLGGMAELLQSYHRFAHNADYMQKDIERYQRVTEQSLVGAIKNYLVKTHRKILIAKPSTPAVAKKDK